MRCLKVAVVFLALLPAWALAQSEPPPVEPPAQSKPGSDKPESKTCEYIHGPFLRLLEDWRKTCGHALCGQVIAADPARVKKSPKPCDAETWLTLKDDMRTTIIGGGAVLMGEVHDNPHHHDLRSRSGMSNFPAAVLEQLSAEQMPAAEAYTTANATKLNDKSLEEFKRAIDWRNQAGASTPTIRCCAQCCWAAARSMLVTLAARQSRKLRKRGLTLSPLMSARA